MLDRLHRAARELLGIALSAARVDCGTSAGLLSARFDVNADSLRRLEAGCGAVL
jgi:hypothetical protein